MLNILFYEPYFLGSHRYFASQYSQYSRHNVSLHTGTGKAWKWASRYSGWEFSEIQNHVDLKAIDVFLCSNYVNLESVLRFLPAHVTVAVYHHENQFAYPVRYKDDRDFHYIIDECNNLALGHVHVFNSHWNLQSTKEGFQRSRRRLPAKYRQYYKSSWAEQARVVYPGLDTNEEVLRTRTKEQGPVRILWSHRWDHDKRPELFLSALRDLEKQNVSFLLHLTGEGQRDQSDAYLAICEEFSQSIATNRTLERSEYLKVLQQSDVMISTASHEFFGLSVHEAFKAGCRLVLPDALSYPELYSNEQGVFFYSSEADISCTLLKAIEFQNVGERQVRTSHDSALDLDAILEDHVLRNC